MDSVSKRSPHTRNGSIQTSSKHNITPSNKTLRKQCNSSQDNSKYAQDYRVVQNQDGQAKQDFRLPKVDFCLPNDTNCPEWSPKVCASVLRLIETCGPFTCDYENNQPIQEENESLKTETEGQICCDPNNADLDCPDPCCPDPNCSDPNCSDPNCTDPNCPDPNCPDPNCPDPCYQDPNCPDQNCSDQNCPDQNCPDPNCPDPCCPDPCYQNPCYQDPCGPDPCFPWTLADTLPESQNIKNDMAIHKTHRVILVDDKESNIRGGVGARQGQAPGLWQQPRQGLGKGQSLLQKPGQGQGLRQQPGQGQGPGQRQGQGAEGSFYPVMVKRSIEIERGNLGLQAGGDSLPIWVTPSRTIGDVERELFDIHTFLLNTPNKKLLEIVELISDLEIILKSIVTNNSGMYEKYFEACKIQDSEIKELTKATISDVQKRIINEQIRTQEAISKNKALRNEVKLVDMEVKKLVEGLKRKTKELKNIKKMKR